MKAMYHYNGFIYKDVKFTKSISKLSEKPA